MPEFASPLRYPGGKAGLSGFLSEVIRLNGLADGAYAEPYAGGAGAALQLLFSERVSRILINDIDRCVFAVWRAVLTRHERFLQLLDETPLTIDEWHRQRHIYLKPARHSTVELGFATFFLNRCNRSGILPTGGPIGGYSQAGKWKLDARFNRKELRRRIEKIISYRERIEAFNLDALVFLKEVVGPGSRNRPLLAYLDPPYYAKGQQLYLSAYKHVDHVKLAEFMRRTLPYRWLMTYDNVPQIRKIYAAFPRIPFNLSYTAYGRRAGQELLIHNGQLTIPRAWLGIVA
jgi:DNA adenine methylase